ncbi:tripartite tricarboxylate transporter substrate binding protein [uncultured Thalassospira sp.]|jgi:tripartite-type tricarboxylate transporter receptor subunit TctC|uniref:tripartite tricarboxylate transporter substrate binding protein n=1 Tax=uncultured Thalassospira sp. TaxID=404382 RepID=UPI0030D94A62|tara:strand:+ start:3706 stop:4644 length:939 start_codon:yes stop_codon:yes gene_type:complete
MNKFSLLVSAALFTLAAQPAFAEYPEQPVEFVVPFPPGDLEDILTRMIADKFQATYGVPAAVVNKPGGGGGPFPGAVAVANAPADGYTIGSFVLDIPLVGPTIGIPALANDPFEPLGIFVTYPFILATLADAPYKNMDALAAYAQNHKLVVGHFGAGATPTEITLATQSAFGFKWGGQAAFDALDCNTLASGDADVINTTLQLVKPCLDKITPLAAVTEKRIPSLPDVPTLGELKPALKLGTWTGLFVRRETPQEARDKIIAVAEEVMKSDAAKKLSEQTGALIYWKNPEESAAQITNDRATLKVIAEMNNN